MFSRVSDGGCGRVRERISRGDAKPLKRSDSQPPAPYKYLNWISNERRNRGWRLEIGSF